MQFDPLAASYDAWFDTPLGAFVDGVEQRALDELLRPAPGERILDLGAGTGRRARLLAARGIDCVALEPSAEMLGMALGSATSRDGPAYVRAVGEQLPFRDRVFDAVLCVNVLEFVADVDAIVREAAGATKIRGRLVFGVLNSAGAWAAERRRSDRQPWTNARFFDRSELEAILSRYGRVETRLAVYVPPGLHHVPRTALAALDELLRRWKPGNGAFIAARLDVR